MATIAEKFKTIRSKSGLTQEDFAHKIGISRSNLAQIEIGKSKPTFEVITLLTSTFNIDANDLLNESIILTDFANRIVNINVNNIHNLENEIVGDTGHKQLRKVEVEAYALKQLNTIRDIRERDEESRSKPIPGLDQPYILKAEILLKLRIAYDKRIRMDLKLTDKNINELLMLIEDTETIIDVVADVNLNYINNKPDPFESSQYYDLEHDTFNIPDTIDYKEYRKEIMVWLKEVEKYQKILSKFYTAADTFLKEVTGRDDYNF